LDGHRLLVELAHGGCGGGSFGDRRGDFQLSGGGTSCRTEYGGALVGGMSVGAWDGDETASVVAGGIPSREGRAVLQD
ncbi:hypothetical protein CLOP_g20535, partial [Closterium sp. NIES-67]